MQHTIRIDGQERVLDIRPMGEDFIVFRKLFAPPLKPRNIRRIRRHDDAAYMSRFHDEGWFVLVEEFLRRQIQALGSCAMLAWEGDGVVGLMRFTTRELYDAFRRLGARPCVRSENMPAAIQSLNEATLARLLASESRTLRVTCLNIGHNDTRYHNQGIATAMFGALKAWARERGWRRLECASCPDVVPFRALGPQVMRRSWLEARGFYVARQTRVPSEEALTRCLAIEQALAGELDAEAWDVRTYPGNIRRVRELAARTSWAADYDADYTMACDL